MHTEICDRLGIEFPIFAFTHCRDVVAAVSNAGGIGVLGAIGFSPEELEMELAWLDEHVGDNPYGVDIVIPGKYEGMGEMDPVKLEAQLQAMVPDDHRRFARRLLAEHGVPEPAEDQKRSGMMGWTEATGKPLLAAALRHDKVKLIANALGTPPADVIAEVQASGRMIGALAGSVKHALAHKAAGPRLHRVPGHRGWRPHRRRRIARLVARGHRRRGPAAGARRGRRGQRSPDRRRAGHGGPGRVGRDVVADGGGGQHLARADEGLPGRHEPRHGAVQVLHGQAVPHAQERLDRGLGPARHARPAPHAAADDGGHRGRRAPRTAIPEEAKDVAFNPCGQVIGRATRVRKTRDVIFDLVEEYAEAVDRLSQTARVEV